MHEVRRHDIGVREVSDGAELEHRRLRIARMGVARSGWGERRESMHSCCLWEGRNEARGALGNPEAFGDRAAGTALEQALDEFATG